MLKDKVLEKLFAHPELQKFPVGAQSDIVHIFEEVLEDLQEENYKMISQLFSK